MITLCGLGNTYCILPHMVSFTHMKNACVNDSKNKGRKKDSERTKAT